VLPDGAAGEKLVAFFEDLAERWKIKRIENLEPGRELPGKKKQHNANNAEPVGNQLARALPGAVRRQRI